MGSDLMVIRAPRFLLALLEHLPEKSETNLTIYGNEFWWGIRTPRAELTLKKLI